MLPSLIDKYVAYFGPSLTEKGAEELREAFNKVALQTAIETDEYYFGDGGIPHLS
jgi:hypothetical protein